MAMLVEGVKCPRILKNFPGKGEWVPRKRPASLIIKR